MGFIAAVVLRNLLFFNGTFYYFDQFIANSFSYNLWIRLTFHWKLFLCLLSVFWHCWFGRPEEHPVCKNSHVYLLGVRYKWFVCCPGDGSAVPPHHLLLY